MNGKAENTVGLLDAATANYSANVAGSWCRIDLGPGLRMLPNRYALRHGSTNGDHLSQNWRLEGRNEKSEG